MHIALFHYKVVPHNPSGSCNLKMITGLYNEHDFTVFAIEFENPAPSQIRWIRIPAPTRPLTLMFLVFHLLAPIYYAIFCLRHRTSVDKIIFTESMLSFGDISYTHFCHRAYLKAYWAINETRGLRRFITWLNHAVRAAVEPWIYQRVGQIVVPSAGLKRELEREYKHTRGKVTVIPNPVDVERFTTPQATMRTAIRSQLKIAPDTALFIFLALGHFERKGLPLILDALHILQDTTPRVTNYQLLVVGGQPDLVESYKHKVAQIGLSQYVTFVGMQRDIRPYLWAADLFILPSSYEVFPLVVLEAAAAGLPLLVSPLNGVEEFMVDGKFGYITKREPREIADNLIRFLELAQLERTTMGKQARQAVQQYRVENFVNHWEAFMAQQTNNSRKQNSLFIENAS